MGVTHERAVQRVPFRNQFVHHLPLVVGPSLAPSGLDIGLDREGHIP